MLYYKDLYWYYQGTLDKKTCNKIIKLGEKQKIIQGRIQSFPESEFKQLTKKQKEVLVKKRDSYVSFIQDDWLFNLMEPYIRTANNFSKWNFDIDYIENMQFTKYGKKQHYDWHCDSGGEEETADPRSHGKIRKLSIVVSLSDPKDYEGGDFQFQYRATDDPNIITEVPVLKTQGTIIVFPSYIWHRVKPITKGTRYSLVGWIRGWPYR